MREIGKPGSLKGPEKQPTPMGLVYEGSFKNAQNHGYGIMTFSDSYRYEGNWKDGKRHGAGQARYRDGTTYVGGFVEGQRSGEGYIKMKDGFSYTGEWLDGEIHGLGTATYANGDVYTGSFVDGRRQGTGTMRYATGGVAERHLGQRRFAAGRRHGTCARGGGQPLRMSLGGCSPGHDRSVLIEKLPGLMRPRALQ